MSKMHPEKPSYLLGWCVGVCPGDHSEEQLQQRAVLC